MNKTTILVFALMVTLYFATFPHGSDTLTTMNTSNAKIYYYGWPFAFISELVEEIPVVINSSGEPHTRILHFESNTLAPLVPMIFLANWLCFSAVLLVINELYLRFKKRDVKT
jgi:hypothetical protein